MAYYNRRPMYLSTTSPRVQETYPTLDVIAAAVIAQRINGGMDKYDSEGRAETRYDGVDEVIPAVAPTVSNKTRMLAVLADPSVITQADRDEAQNVIDNIRGQVTMGLLGGKKVGGFITDMAAAMEGDTVPKFRIGMLAYAPNMYETSKTREAIAEKVNESLYTSQPLGAVGSKVSVAFNLIDKRYIEQYGMWAVFGNDGRGNLVGFVTKHEALATSGNVVGKIKKVGNDQWRNNAMVTSLNYVKRG